LLSISNAFKKCGNEALLKIYNVFTHAPQKCRQRSKTTTTTTAATTTTTAKTTRFLKKRSEKEK